MAAPPTLASAATLPHAGLATTRDPPPETFAALAWAPDAELDRLVAFSKLPLDILPPDTRPIAAPPALKPLCRTGLPLWLRGHVWFLLSGGGAVVLRAPDLFASAAARVFHDSAAPAGVDDLLAAPLLNVPSFSAPLYADDPLLGAAYDAADAPRAALGPRAAREADLVLVLLAAENPDLHFVPALPSFLPALLLFMDAPAAYAACTGMIEASRSRGWYFPLSRRALALFVETFASLAASKASKVAKHLAKLGVSLAALAAPWLSSLFFGFLPLYAALDIFDAYISEGSKILYRVGLALLRTLAPALRAATTRDAALAIVGTGLRDVAADRDAFEAMLASSYSIHLQRKKFAMLTSAHAAAGVDEGAYGSAVLYYRPTVAPPSATLSYELFSLLWYALPSRHRLHTGTRVFSAAADGYSLALACAAGPPATPALLLVSLAPDTTIGAYLPDGLPPPSFEPVAPGGNIVWLGNGESFVFTAVHPSHDAPLAVHAWDPDAPSGRAAFYRLIDSPASGASSDRILVVGESGAGRALTLSPDFALVTTGPSDTFASPPLVPPTFALPPDAPSPTRPGELRLGPAIDVELYVLTP